MAMTKHEFARFMNSYYASIPMICRGRAEPIEVPEPIPADEEHDKAMAYWVRTGDPTSLHDLSEKRSNEARWREVWD